MIKYQKWLVVLFTRGRPGDIDRGMSNVRSPRPTEAEPLIHRVAMYIHTCSDAYDGYTVTPSGVQYSPHF